MKKQSQKQRHRQSHQQRKLKKACRLSPPIDDGVVPKVTRAQNKLRFREHLNKFDQNVIFRDYESMLQNADAALNIFPFEWEALAKRALALNGLERFLEALDYIDRAMMAARLAKVADIRKILGPPRADILYGLGRFEDALAECDLSSEIIVSLRRALTLSKLGRYNEALVSLSEAITSDPDNAEAHVISSFVHLLLGQYDEGWREFEWRLEAGDGLGRRYLALPRWTGKELVEGKTVLLRAEQGLGDTLQFIRYAPLLAARGARVVAEVDPSLAGLVSGIEGITAVVSNLEAFTDWDIQCPIMSLPFAFGTTLESIPNKTPYLTANPVKVAAWRERLECLAGLRVGLVWSGNPRLHDPAANAVDQRRSVTLEHFSKLANVPGVSLVSLQKGEAALQTRSPPPGMFIHDWTDELYDFADTAALIEALDLVISVDTSVAHLAGGLGKPVWLLNRFDTCWRWLLDREDSPWYPTLRQFRQPKLGDWATVISRVAAELAASNNIQRRTEIADISAISQGAADASFLAAGRNSEPQGGPLAR